MTNVGRLSLAFVMCDTKQANKYTTQEDLNLPGQSVENIILIYQNTVKQDVQILPIGSYDRKTI